jgi:hypothetical protein
MLSEIDWTQFPGPRWYDPASVPEAFEALLSVDSEVAAESAYNRMLFAVGNNHAGTLYPAAAAAVHEVLRIAEERAGWVRSAALEILFELLRFAPEPDFATFERRDGAVVDVKLEIALAAHRAAPFLLRVLESPDSPENDRLNALWALDAGPLRPERLPEVIRGVLAASPPRALERECLRSLEELERASVSDPS